MPISRTDIERRLLLAKYPRRAKARFKDAPDHNPLVLEDCPHCGGRGSSCEVSGGMAVLGDCDACGGEGITGGVVRYFTNEAPVRDAVLDADGWLTCPGCERRFSTSSAHSWTGLRHITCGQKIRAAATRSPPPARGA